GNVTIYSRDLKSGATEVVSTDASGTTLADGQNVAELDVSSDGSRVLIGDLLKEAGGNRYWHLYMHFAGSPDSVDLTPETAAGEPITGVTLAGMSDDGSVVYFATADQMSSDDTDTSVDLYRADIGSSSSSIARVSTGVGGTGDTDACDPAGN